MPDNGGATFTPPVVEDRRPATESAAHSCHTDRSTIMRDIIHWVLAFTLLSAAFSVYWKHRSTTYRTADGACQSLTVEDECY
jgi:hypothetical protein